MPPPPNNSTPSPTTASFLHPAIVTSTDSPDLRPPTPRPRLRKSTSYPQSTSDDDDDDEDLDEDESSSSSSSTSSTRPPLHPSNFAPPFYNRPPTPLPPSPSLTSLLRPPFTPSRPTTPDSSDSEAVATSSRIAQNTPRYAPKVPTYEYYGFVLYVISTLSFGMYMIWSFSPAELLHAMGIHYYPSRWWSLALPSYLVVLVIYIFVALAAYNTGYLTRGLESVECFVDEAAKIAAVSSMVEESPPPASPDELISPISPLDGREEKVEIALSIEARGEKWTAVDSFASSGGDWKSLWSRGTDAVMDVPVGGVCEVLYGDSRDREDWEVETDKDDEEDGMAQAPFYRAVRGTV